MSPSKYWKFHDLVSHRKSGRKDQRVMKKIKAAGIFILTILAQYFAWCVIYPVDENNVLQVPDWILILGTVISFAVTFLYYKKPTKGNYSAASPIKKCLPEAERGEEPPFKIPLSQKKREEMAENFLNTAELSASIASETTYVLTFIEEWDEMMVALKNLTWLEGKVKSMSGSPSADVRKLNSEFQWKLRDAIERARDAAISDIRGVYRNSKERKKFRASSFIDDINDVRDRFSEETSEFTYEAVQMVRQASGYYEESQTEEDTYNFMEFGGVDAELLSVDLMEGHEFERWCADLLKKSGFSNVSVTPGSGDQGVDVLAEKDGIRYAIQCKCYSSDLGNTPVQEVNTGKVFYRCQIGVVMTNRYFTNGAKEAASATGTLLWDRDKLRQMIESAK